MKNFLRSGETLTVPAPHAVAAGSGVLIGSIFGIAAGDAEQGKDVEVATVGVFEIGKAVVTEVITLGDVVLWDDATQGVTTVQGMSLGLLRIGVAVAPSGRGAATVAVRLDGAAS